MIVLAVGGAVVVGGETGKGVGGEGDVALVVGLRLEDGVEGGVLAAEWRRGCRAAERRRGGQCRAAPRPPATAATRHCGAGTTCRAAQPARAARGAGDGGTEGVSWANENYEFNQKVKRWRRAGGRLFPDDLVDEEEGLLACAGMPFGDGAEVAGDDLEVAGLGDGGLAVIGVG